VPEGLVAQAVLNVIPLIFIEVFLIKEIINFSIAGKTKHKVIMFHPGQANHFKCAKIQFRFFVGKHEN
jgi:hypothetical protein